MKFKGYSLHPDFIQTLEELGYVEPTPVQEQTLALSLRGESLIVKAETGSGKTHAYLIPLIEKLDAELFKIQAIILEPTLELCMQCQKFANQIAEKYPKFKTMLGSSLNEEKYDFDAPTILISTPEKLYELLFKRHFIEVKHIKLLVLDEMDMLLEGNQDQVLPIVQQFNVQKLIYTATMKEHEIASLKKMFRVNKSIIVDKKNFASKNVKHHFVDIKHKDKAEALQLFLQKEQPYFTLVFASKKQEIQRIYKKLCEDDVRCALLSGDLSLNERKNIIRQINEGRYELVLCSDLASRGLDFEKVTHVISLDIPSNIDYYYHRAGRTGRYKDQGDSYVFYDDELNKKSKQILEKKLTFDYLVLRNEGLKQDKKHNPQPKKINQKLEAEIKKEVAKVRSKKVKPNYKKKMRMAAKKAEQNHKRKIIMENLKSKKKALAYKED